MAKKPVFMLALRPWQWCPCAASQVRLEGHPCRVARVDDRSSPSVRTGRTRQPGRQGGLAEVRGCAVEP